MVHWPKLRITWPVSLQTGLGAVISPRVQEETLNWSTLRVCSHGLPSWTPAIRSTLPLTHTANSPPLKGTRQGPIHSPLPGRCPEYRGDEPAPPSLRCPISLGVVACIFKKRVICTLLLHHQSLFIMVGKGQEANPICKEK